MNIRPPFYHNVSSSRHSITGGYADSYSDSYGYGDPYAAYEQQLLQYISQLRIQMQYLQEGTAAYAQAQQYYFTALQYLQMIDPQMAMDPTLGGTGWDPLMGNYGNSDSTYGSDSYGPNASAPQGPSFPVSYQDQNHIVTEDGSEVTIPINRNDSDPRTVDTYQANVTLMIPSNAAQVNVTETTEESGRPMAVVTIVYPNGPTRIVQVHNPETLRIETPQEENVIIDASVSALASVIQITEPGEENEGPHGTPPDETNDVNRIWNTHDTVDYFPTEGSEIDRIFADTINVTLPDRSHTAWVTKVDEHEYVIEIRDAAGNLVRRVEAYQIDRLNFAGVDEENFYFKDETRNPPDENHILWSDPTHSSDPRLTVGGEAGGEAQAQGLNPDHLEDTAPTSLEGDTALFSTPDVEATNLHTYFGGDVHNYEITTAGEVHLYPQDLNDQVTIERDEQDPERVLITITNAQGEQVVYKVKGPPSRISIHALPQNVKVKVWTSEAQGIWAWVNFEDLEPSQVEEWFSNIEVPGSEAGIGSGATGAEFIQTLANITGKTEEQVTAALLLTYSEVDSDGNGILSGEELEAAKSAHVFPPMLPNSRFFEFLYRLDGALADHLDQFAVGDARTRDAMIGDLRRRLVELLGLFYEDVSAPGGNGAGHNRDNIYINGTEYDFIAQELNGPHRGGWDNRVHFENEPWRILTLFEQHGANAEAY